MRRIGAVLAAGLLMLTFGSAAVGASSRNSFNGDFDAWMGETLVGHITAQTSGLAAGPGTYAFTSYQGGNNGSALIGDAKFYAQDGFNEVWFKALEVGYPTEGYGIFIAHVVDMLDPGETDYVEFWSAPINWDFADGTIGVTWNGTMQVGAGAFVVKVRASDPLP